jgi:RHS repeat-associated protein
MNAQDLMECVDLPTGQARAMLPIFLRAGRGGLNMALDAVYGSGVLGTAIQWNQSAPTGILGLGWSIPRDRIIALRGSSMLTGDRSIVLILDGAATDLQCIGTASNGTSSWAASAYAFLRISYNPAQELWTVIDEDGLIRQFGGSASGHGTVDWGVAWGGWSGPNAGTSGQIPMVTSWSLASVSNLFGDSVRYSYTQVGAAVGTPSGLQYTQASYLTAITGTDGSSIAMSYSVKTAAEYQDPHTNPAPPNVWQDAFETHYLSSASLCNVDGSTQEKVSFGYATTPLGSGALTKRLLVSVTRSTGAGILKEPSTTFSYWGQAAGDGVSASTVYADGALYGALKQIRLPAGGTLQYIYQQNTLTFANRSCAIAPAGGSNGWQQPVVYQSDHFTLVTWIVKGVVQVQAYCWNGRWLTSTVMSVTLPAGVDYGAIQVAAGPDCCAVLAGSSVTVAAVDTSQAGGWFPAANYTLNPALGSGETATLVAGLGFAAVLGLASGNLFCFRFSGDQIATAGATGWTTDTLQTLTPTGSRFALAAYGATLVAVAIPSIGGSASVTMAQRLPTGVWSQTQQSLDLGSLGGTTLSMYIGEGFAIAMSTARAPSGTSCSYGALWWSADGATLSAVHLPNLYTTSTAPTPIIVGATVVIGQQIQRFIGTGWVSAMANSHGYVNATGSPILSVGADLIARRFPTSDGGGIADLLVFDPASQTWAVPSNLSVTGSSGNLLAATAPNTRYAVGNYAMIGNNLWSRAANGTWSSVLSLPSGLNATDIASLCLLGDDYLILQQGSGTASQATQVYPLVNGGVVSTTALSLSGQQIQLPDNTAGGLIGRNAFAAYSGTYGESGGNFALYRPVSGNIEGAQVAYCVANVSSDNGFGTQASVNGTLSTAFSYAAGTIDPEGWVPLFNTVTVVPGQTSTTSPANGTSVFAYYNGLSKDETPATAYPSNSNIGGRTHALAGTLYQSTISRTDPTALTPILGTTVTFTLTLLPLGTVGVGCYARPTTTSTIQDGVAASETTTFSTTTGLPVSRTATVNNTSGTLDSFTEVLSYVGDKYPGVASLNLLSPVVQRQIFSQPNGASTSTVVATEVQTWKDWTGQGAWGPHRQYRGLSTSASFSAWASGQTPPVTDFLLGGQVMGRGPRGQVLAMADALGTVTSTIYDSSGTYVVATAENCAPGAATWYGCEPYESAGAWTSSNPNSSFQSYITSADYHTGSRCLLLPANAGGHGPLLIVQPADQTRRYLFSCWARTDAAFAPASGTAAWIITPFDPNSGTPVGSAITLTLTPTGSAKPSAVGQWAYFQATIDLPSLVKTSGNLALALSIQASNANDTLPCYVDELRFMPVDADFAAVVYELQGFVPLASIDTNGQSECNLRNNRDQPYLSLGANGRVRELALFNFARFVNGADRFQSATPNTSARLSSSVGSLFYDFHNGSMADWTVSDANQWSITNGQLRYGGGGSTSGLGSTAACALLNNANMAIRVDVVPPTGASATVAMGANGYFLRWSNATTQWDLVAAGAPQTSLASSAAPFDANWLFVMIDGLIVCYAGDTQLFGYMPTTQPTASATSLAATGAASFDDLVLLADPTFDITAVDGFGEAFSTIGLVGYQTSAGNPLFPDQWVVSSRSLFRDGMGRMNVTGQPLYAPVPALISSAPLLPMDQATYLYSGSGTQLGTVSAYLSGSSGRSFSSTGFEASPLGRPSSQDAPRPAFTTGDTYFTLAITYGSSNSLTGSPASGTGLYLVQQQQALRQTTATPSASATAITTLDQLSTDTFGRVLMRQSGPVGGTLRQTGYLYDSAGRLSTIRHPNYYAPPMGSSAVIWQESYAYDFLGRVTSRTTPDSGTVQVAYDSLDRPRFVYDANGAPVTSGGTQTILYYRYDALGRVVECGYLRDARYSWGNAALGGMLNTAGFPNIVNTPSGPLDAAGAWSKRILYDIDANFTSGASFTRFLLGRPVQVTINPSDNATSADTETYAYDADGNVLSKTVAMPGITPAGSWSVNYGYDDSNRVNQIGYPTMGGGGTAPQVGYGYDRLGRLAAVGGQPTGAVVDPLHPPSSQDKSYAGYSFDTYGSLVGADYNNLGTVQGPTISRRFGFDSYRRLASITDNYFGESLGYTSGTSMSGWNYFQSQIASSTASYSGSANWSQPPGSITQSLGYDGHGRLTSSLSSLGNPFSLTLGIGTGAAYDANGNIQGITRGISQNAYSYTPASGILSNRIQAVNTSANAAVDYSAASPVANGWSYGSNNGGPSNSVVNATAPVTGNKQALCLAGGSPGHYEVLRLLTFVPAGVVYTLSWSAATGAGYPSSPSNLGAATWYAVLNDASGPVAVLPLKTLAASPSSWTADSATLDLTPSGLLALAGISTEVVWVSIELRNLCQGSNGGTGAVAYVQSAGFACKTNDSASTSFGYDGNGNVVSASGRSLGSMSYNANTGRVTSIAAGPAATTTQLSFAYSGGDQRSRATVTPPSASGAPAQRTITLIGAFGETLATQVSLGTKVSSNYVIHGAQGPLALQTSAGALRYLLTDRLGSPRAMVDGATGNVLGTADYLPFGDMGRRTGVGTADTGFTAQRPDDATGLYNFQARLYDPALGRFYGTDPGQQFSSPYIYGGNDPGNLVDPDGGFAVAAAAAFGAGYLLYEHWDNFSGLQLTLIGGTMLLASQGGAMLSVGIGGNNMFYTDAHMGVVRGNRALNIAAGLLGSFTGSAISSGATQAAISGAAEWNRNGSTAGSVIKSAARDGGYEFLIGGLRGIAYGLAAHSASYALGRFSARYTVPFFRKINGKTVKKFNDSYGGYLFGYKVRVPWLRRQVINFMSPEAVEKVRQAANKKHWNNLKNALRLGGLHEWLEVGMAATARKWGVSSDQITSFTTPTTVNPMFNWPAPAGGAPIYWRHAYNYAHQQNTRLLYSSPGLLVYYARLQASGLIAPPIAPCVAYPLGSPGAAPGSLFTWWDLLAWPWRF